MQTQEELQEVSKDQTMIKGKRNKRERAPSPPRFAKPTSTSTSTNNSIDSATTSTTTNTPIESIEEEDMVNCLILLAQGTHHVAAATPDQNINYKRSTNPRVFRCKTCNKCFPSFQSLGGHRTSHRKPKENSTSVEEAPTFVRDSDPTTSTTLSLKTPNRVNSLTSTSTVAVRVHRCSTCYAEFSSGQALGGHMRRHRNLVNASSMTSMSGDGGGSQEYQGAKKPLNLDLNLPAAPEEDQGESKFSFQQRENVIVFSNSLVNCNY
ncbi:hypothetical protein PHAVU_007G151700 [Phaseolus vulgaris]|uniref:C2H2-type domain-containing protein n=1 Tax=Phaseolus vulgaris TaxID=3885 RepID=V7BEY1_PHAVU|nr:hypothetical protein PHAVU_007G151700g [Phaseolus vulgaris]ESW16377.1 hypothetical protein PHAVU_007G151700g [Phaseolus vulgaris]